MSRLTEMNKMINLLNIVFDKDNSFPKLKINIKFIDYVKFKYRRFI